MGRWEDFRQCPGCGFDPATGEGFRNCSYYDCPYLPEELDVFCPTCRFDFFTQEGNPSCPDPAGCEDGREARSRVPNITKWLERVS